jgi:hypothetical protein
MHGGYMGDIWVIYGGGYMEDIWRIYGGYMEEDIWGIYGREIWAGNIFAPRVIITTNAMLLCSCKGCAIGAIRQGTGKVLSFYVNFTDKNHNLASKKSTVPQDYSESVIPCGKRGAISHNLTVS